jgi:hypothetical protein
VAHSDLIDSLIETYRTLNMSIRPLAAAQADQITSGGRSLRDVVAELRESELITSQQLKNMTMADVRTADQVDNVSLPEPFDPQSVRVLLSEFGTAREAILALVRNMPEEQLDAERPSAAGGTTTIRAVIEDLVKRDQKVMSELQGLVSARAV